jgi:serine/threonine-protein kinase
MEVTAASDVYSLGVVAYECLSGARPFDGASQVAIALAHINRPPPPLPAEVPPAVRLLVERALAKDPADRFADGGAFAEAIRRVAAGGTLAAPVPLSAPATTPTQVVGGIADGATQVFPAGAAGAGGPPTGPAGTMPPLQAPDDDDWVDDGQPPANDRGRKRALWIAAALVLLALVGAGAWLLLGGDQDDPDAAPRTSASATTSASAALVSLAADDFIGRNADEVEAELDGLGLDASQEPATDDMIDEAGQDLAVGDVADLNPADTPLAQGEAVTLYVVPESDEVEEEPEETTEAPAPTTAAPTTSAAPTPTSAPPSTSSAAPTTTTASSSSTAAGSTVTDTESPSETPLGDTEGQGGTG